MSLTSVNLTRLLWMLALALAVVVVGLTYLGRDEGEPKTTVMVATQLIPAGIYVRPGTFEFVTVRQDEVEAGTLTDVKVIAMHAVAHPIQPGKRFAASDFSP
jgi:hypothetical protein